MQLFIPENAFTPHRQSFLQTLGFNVQTYDMHEPENILYLREDPRAYLKKYAQKHMDLSPFFLYTGIFCGRRLLGQPTSPCHARDILKLLSGRRHRLYTVMALKNFNLKIDVTHIKLKRFDVKEIDHLSEHFPLYPASALLNKIEYLRGSPGAIYGTPYLPLTHYLKNISS